jgi:putative ABC transport system permease protein
VQLAEVTAIGGLAWAQLRYRPARLVALLLGLLVATSAFTVLTAASKTSQLRTVGTVTSNFVPAYEILVRPKGTRTELENATDTVQPNFLSGIYGGITMGQYHEISRIPGVDVAAPIAMVGYALLYAPITFTVPSSYYSGPGRELFRISTTWTSDGGTSHVTQPASYLYVTPNRLVFDNESGDIEEEVPDKGTVGVCPFSPVTAGQNPFGISVQSSAQCWSKLNGSPPPFGSRSHNPVVVAGWVMPVLIAAIDPVAEAKLDGLNGAVTSGKYLSENAGDSKEVGEVSSFPVLASSSVGMDETAQTQIQLLGAPSSAPTMNLKWLSEEAPERGPVLSTHDTTAAEAYKKLLGYMSKAQGLASDVQGYWSVGPISYERSRTGALVPESVSNPESEWYTAGFVDVSLDDEDTQYRVVTGHSHDSNQYPESAGPFATPKLVGVFDPEKIEAFDQLSDVPLGAYQPVVASPVTSASKSALHGGDLLPNENLGGYVSQPVNLVTTLSALPALQNPNHYGGNLHTGDPISVIRVRVSGVSGPDSVSLARIKEVAQQIALRTGLDVDIVAGSSPTPTRVDLPAGKFGQPALALSENWVKKGVAIAILSAVDRDSVVLFVLILVVCGLFVANSAVAAIRARRRELGMLSALGWTAPRIFAGVLFELVMIGLVAGILGFLVALPLSAGLGLHTSVGRAALAIPVALSVAVVAGSVPAWIAARARPAASVRPPVLSVRRARNPRGVTGVALVNVLRTPGRAVVAIVSLGTGITALTVLLAVTFAFHGVVVGSLLGDAVALQVRGVDYVAVAVTIALGMLAVADVMTMNIRERSAELATIRAFGWPERSLGRLVVTEGLVIGIVGSVLGAGVGLFAASKLAGQLPDALYVIVGGEVLAGLLVTATAALVPAQALRRLPAARLLAEEY